MGSTERPTPQETEISTYTHIEIRYSRDNLGQTVSTICEKATGYVIDEMSGVRMDVVHEIASRIDAEYETGHDSMDVTY